jgi:hypothetical protein
MLPLPTGATSGEPSGLRPYSMDRLKYSQQWRSCRSVFVIPRRYRFCHHLLPSSLLFNRFSIDFQSIDGFCNACERSSLFFVHFLSTLVSCECRCTLIHVCLCHLSPGDGQAATGRGGEFGRRDYDGHTRIE